jgi:uncharacterized membrane protein YccC
VAIALFSKSLPNLACSNVSHGKSCLARVRSGIKFGLAAVLALYIAEVLRLEHPNWAIFTVLSMMSVPYVGSIIILAITQVLGTFVGTLVGIWLAGDYASTPIIFLTLFFSVLAFAGYKFG